MAPPSAAASVRRETTSLLRTADRDKARLRLVELFNVVGNEDPRVTAARKDLTRALY